MSMRRGLGIAALLSSAVLVSCASGGRLRQAREEEAGASQARPALHVVYPPSGVTLTATDSSFIFGSVRPAGARVTVNGMPARQAPGGGWLAYVPIAPGEFVYHIEARAPGPMPAADVTRPDGTEGGTPVTAKPEPEGSRGGPGSVVSSVEWPVLVPGRLDANWMGVLDSASVSPRDSMELETGDRVPLRFKGLPGLDARVVLGPDFASAAFVEEPPGDINVGRRVFGAAGGDLSIPSPSAWSWYRAELVLPPPLKGELARAEGQDHPAGKGHRETLPRLARRPRIADPAAAWEYGSSAPLAIEIGHADSLLRYVLPHPVRLRDPGEARTVVLNDDADHTGRTDGRVVGLTSPDGVYSLFLPNGTRAAAGRRVGKFVELLLDRDLSVWADASHLHPLPLGTPSPRSLVHVVRTRRLGDWTRIFVPLEEALPVQVRQETHPARYFVTIYGATAATEFMRYDFGDRLVQELRWSQPARERFVLEVELDQRQPWGFRYGYQDSDFYLDVRRAPELRGGLFHSILRGLRIVVDPGHSPEPGAVGPTGFQEKDANLAVGLELARRLQEAGAEVILTRSGESPPEGLSLNDRTNLAARKEADLLVSVHHNALPDGVNPFENNGTSTYYYHTQSLPLARAIQRELLKELRLPDFGIAHGNLALARPTEMPAVLTEAAFMMIPEQEELLRTNEFQEREARAIVRGIKRFLEESRRR